jgi:Zn-dependent protease with chaperone function
MIFANLPEGNMKRAWVFILLFAILVSSFVVTRSVQAQEETPERDPVFEQAVYDKLELINPEAVPVFTAATEAMDRQDYQTAIEGFLQVLAMAPDFPDALRRLGNCLISSGNLEEGLNYISRAYQLDPSPANQSAYALGLLMRGNEGDDLMAFNLAQKATESDPDDIYYHYVLFEAAMVTKNDYYVQNEANRIISLAPQNPESHYLMSLAYAYAGEMNSSYTELKEAKKLGLSEEDYQAALDNFGLSKYLRIINIAKAAGFSFVGWLLGFPILLIVGGLLSRKLLALIDKEYAQPNYILTQSERSLRSVYKAVIGISSAYFYISIPFVIALVLAIFGGIILLFFYIGWIPVQATIMLGLVGLFTILILIRSLFVKVKLNDPGRTLKPNDAPEFWTLVVDVAAKTGAHSVDMIYITPGTDISVNEYNYRSRHKKGKKRNLILGLGALTNLNQSQFQAILAHEYGHFLNKDTAGGELAWKVNQTIWKMAYGLVRAGAISAINPGWWFIKIYSKIYAKITLGASRLQEYLADRQAAMLYGIESLLSGLRQLIYRDVEFDKYITQIATAGVAGAAPAQHNLYSHSYDLNPENHTELINQVDKYMKEPTGEFDSHPSYNDRFSYLHNIQKAPLVVENNRPIINLIPNYTALSEEMSEEIWKKIREVQKKSSAVQNQ